MSRWKRFLSMAETEAEFRYRFNLLARNASGWMDFGDPQELNALNHLVREGKIQDAIALATQMLQHFYKKQLGGERDILSRKKAIRRKRREREWYKQEVEQFGLYDFDSDELVPIIHGGDLGRILSIVYCGRGYRTTTSMPNPHKGVFEYTGFMVHSEYAGRALYYAESAAKQRLGIPAILMARIPKWALYHNQGDEYSVPHWHYHMLRDIKILTNMDKEYYDAEYFYYEHYLKKVK